MIDYIFFDDGLMNRFIAFLRRHEVEFVPDIEGRLIQLSEELEEELLASIEDEYDLLLSETEQLLEGTEQGLEKNLAAVRVELSDGRGCNIKLPPDLLARILQCISVEELQDLVQTVARAVEDPVDRPVCQL